MIKDIKIDKFAWIGFGATLFATIFAIIMHACISVIFELICFVFMVLVGLIGQTVNVLKHDDVFDNEECDKAINFGTLNIFIIVGACMIARLANLI